MSSNHIERLLIQNLKPVESGTGIVISCHTSDDPELITFLEEAFRTNDKKLGNIGPYLDVIVVDVHASQNEIFLTCSIGGMVCAA